MLLDKQRVLDIIKSVSSEQKIGISPNTLIELYDALEKETEKLNKILSSIKEQLQEHEEQGCCTNYDKAQDELNKDVSNAFDYAYDCGRYETLQCLCCGVQNIIEGIE